MTAITAETIAELYGSGSGSPDTILIRFLDDHSLDVIPRLYLTDISWTDRGRPVRVLATQQELNAYLALSEASCPEAITETEFSWFAEAATENEYAIAHREDESAAEEAEFVASAAAGEAWLRSPEGRAEWAAVQAQQFAEWRAEAGYTVEQIRAAAEAGYTVEQIRAAAEADAQDVRYEAAGG